MLHIFTEALERCRHALHACLFDLTAKQRFVPFALETYGALSARSDRFWVECASLASRGCGGSGLSYYLASCPHSQS